MQSLWYFQHTVHSTQVEAFVTFKFTYFHFEGFVWWWFLPFTILCIFKMEVETGEDKSKKEIFWRGGRIGKFDQEGRWSVKKSPDLRSPEVGISDTHCGISRVGMLSSLYQHVVEWNKKSLPPTLHWDCITGQCFHKPVTNKKLY